jgi:hypothetical protein
LTGSAAWHNATDAWLRLASTEEDWLPFAEVLWDFGSTSVLARVENVQGTVRVTGFEVTSVGEVPASMRRLPSNLQVMDALRGLGNRGISVVAYLLAEHDKLSEEFQKAIAGIDGPAPESAVEAALEDYIKAVNRRPRARIRSQVGEVRAMLDRGIRTSDIVESLVTGGVSEATAYRRIKEARNVSQES